MSLLKEVKLSDSCEKLSRGGWQKMPMSDDIKNLLIGQSVFSKKSKDIINEEKGYFKLVPTSKEDNILAKIESKINVYILSARENKLYVAEI